MPFGENLEARSALTVGRAFVVLRGYCVLRAQQGGAREARLWLVGPERDGLRCGFLEEIGEAFQGSVVTNIEYFDGFAASSDDDHAAGQFVSRRTTRPPFSSVSITVPERNLRSVRPP